ncbi:MAG: hypothetical protein CME24_21310 [Gemmatimonadetes bacterium]|nr:hypothetical protein [Gemmatimonadota bacterium]
MNVHELSSKHLTDYVQDGFTLVSGLMGDSIATAAELAMWSCMKARPDDPDTWPDSFAEGVDHPDIIACYTDAFLQVAAQLGGESSARFEAPGGALAINIFPTEEPWQPPGPHIDHAIKEHGHRTFPRPFRVATMTFLDDVEYHCGGTAVWPGSHQAIERLARSDEERYGFMWTLNQDLHRAEVGDPVILTPRRGDVLFYDALCAHGGSANTGSRPRLALNHKW